MCWVVIGPAPGNQYNIRPIFGSPGKPSNKHGREPRMVAVRV